MPSPTTRSSVGIIAVAAGPPTTRDGAVSPDAIADFIRWFCRTVDSDVPSRAYGVRSAEVMVQGGSVEDDDAMVNLVTRHPMATDRDGFYVRPSQAAIESIRYRNPRRAAYLRFLSVRGDWEAAGWRLGLDGDESRAYAVAAIRDFRSRLRARAVPRVTI